MTNRAGQNRPFKFGANDRREFIVQNSEVALRLVNDASGNPIYIGRAKVGVLDSEQKWQIANLAYDANGNPISQIWPQNDLNNASAEYEFIWNNATAVSVSDITQANPGVVTTSTAHGFSNGDTVYFLSVGGMTEVNWDSTTAKLYKVANATATTFELTDLDDANVDTTGFTAYTSGGTVQVPSWANYTYS